MALVVADRVQETTTTSGTGTLSLGGAVAGFQTFVSGIGSGNTTFYTIYDPTAQVWEVGLGTVTSGAPATLSRTTVYSNSSGTTAKINLAGNTTYVFCVYPASRSVNLDASGNVTPLGTIASGTWQGTTVGVAYGGTGVTASSGANSVVLRDANQNISANSIVQALTSTTAAGGITTLTAASPHFQILNGTGTQTFKLPDATSLPTGSIWIFDNDATGNLTVTDNAGATVDLVAPGGYSTVFLEANGTVAGTWGRFGMIPAEVDWGTNSLNLNSTIVSGGTWQGGTIQPGYGGTGLTTFVAANNALYSSGASTLTAGTLPVAAGGTGITSGTSGGIPYYSSSSAIASSSALAANALVVGGGAGVAPSTITTGTGVVTALGVNTGTAGSFVVNGGALGTPSSGTVTNLTGTASININGTVGATTPNTGAFTTLSASGGVTFSGGTANGVLYLNGSKVATSGSALTFDGANLLTLNNGTSGQFNIGPSGTGQGRLYSDSTGFFVGSVDSIPFIFRYANSEQMRLTSTGLGIGTSSPAAKLDVVNGQAYISATSSQYALGLRYNSTTNGTLLGSPAANTFTISTWGGTEQLRLDSSGNLGLGVTPSAWSTAASRRAMQLGYAGGGALYTSGSGTTLSGVAHGAYYDGTNWVYGASALAGGRYEITGANAGSTHAWYNSAGGTAGNAITFTQAMTLDASGNLNLGQTSSALQSGGTGITVYGSTSSEIKFLNSTTGATASDGTAFVATGANFTINNREAGSLVFSTSNTQQAVIDSSGNLGIGTSSPAFKLDVSGITRVLGGSASSATFGSNQYIRIDTNANGGYTVGAPSAGGITTGYYFTSGTVSYAGGIEYQNTTNALTLRTNNTVQATLDSSGNLGIGTASPGSKLDVKGTLRLSGSSSGYVGFAPAAAAGSTTYTLPSADGTSGQVLSTNGAGTLSWATASGGSGISIGKSIAMTMVFGV